MSDRHDALLGALLRTEFPALYLRLDAQERVVDCNRHTQALLGSPAHGKAFAELLTNFDAHRSALDMARAGGHHRVNVMTCAQLPLTIVCAFSEVPGGVLVVGGADPQEQETLRRSLMGSNQSLSNRGRELQRANAELERSNALKSRFVGMAAHDLRSPIMAIKLASQELVQALADNPTHVREELDALNRAASFMGHIVDDFLDVALIDASQLELRVSRTSLRGVIEEALRMALPRARRKAVSLVFEPQVDFALDCDASRLQQVLMNLLNNAVDHSPEGGATVTVALEQRQQRALIHVRDQGQGVAPEVRDNLFSAFVHGQDKTMGERSIGLGLAISRHIVDAHHGDLLLESTPSGSTFTVSLPMPR
jgi:two-component system, OmpR family, sensor kinase